MWLDEAPFTLMLGPIESLDAEVHGRLTSGQRGDVGILARNAGRLRHVPLRAGQLLRR